MKQRSRKRKSPYISSNRLWNIYFFYIYDINNRKNAHWTKYITKNSSTFPWHATSFLIFIPITQSLSMLPMHWFALEKKNVFYKKGKSRVGIIFFFFFYIYMWAYFVLQINREEKHINNSTAPCLLFQCYKMYVKIYRVRLPRSAIQKYLSYFRVFSDDDNNKYIFWMLKRRSFAHVSSLHVVPLYWHWTHVYSLQNQYLQPTVSNQVGD